MNSQNENMLNLLEAADPCRSCYYQEINYLGRICQHKRSMENLTENKEENGMNVFQWVDEYDNGFGHGLSAMLVDKFNIFKKSFGKVIFSSYLYFFIYIL